MSATRIPTGRALPVLPGLQEAWPRPTSPMPALTGLGAVAAGLVGALLLPTPVPGIGVLLTGLAVTAATLPLARRRLGPHQIGLGVLALALLAVVAVRDSPDVVALCLIAAGGLASYALAGGRTWTGLLLGSASTALAGLRAPAWVLRGVTAARPGSGGRAGILRGTLLACLLLLVFGALFRGADPAFAAQLDRLLPDLAVADLPVRTFLFAAVAGLAVAASLLAAAPPRWDALAPPPGRGSRRAEWVIPIAALDLLFLSFLAIQATVLFGGRDHVLGTAGLTFAEYARQGFAQLLAATAMTLVVVAVASRTAPRTGAGDRLLVRTLLGVLCLLCLFVVGSALWRLGLYEDEFGFTAARLGARTVEAWFGLVLVLVGAALIAGRTALLPRAIAISGALTLLVFAAANPDGRVAAHNVARFEQTGRIDTAYLGRLSADAVPALDRLPSPTREEVLACLARPLSRPRPWSSANLGRAQARAILAERPATGLCRYRNRRVF